MDDAHRLSPSSEEPLVQGEVDWHAADQQADPAHSDDGLLDAWRRHHDEAAFSELCRRHLPLVRRICERCRSPDPDEAMQAVMILLADRNRNQPRGDHLGGWLVITARRVTATQQRSAVRRRRHEEGAAREDQHRRQLPAEEDGTEVLPHLDRALAALSAGRREAVVRYYLQGQPPAVIARELGCSVGAVRVRIHEGLEKLRASLSGRRMPVTAAGLVGLLGVECHAGQAMDGAAVVQAALTPTQAAAAIAKAAVVGWSASAATLLAGGLALVAASTITISAVINRHAPAPAAPLAVTVSPPISSHDRWRDATIGVTITWGLHALAAERWHERPAIGSSTDRLMASASIPLTEYQELAKDFRGEGFDAEVLVRAAREAGARYLYVVAKERDGFALYDSRVSAYNAVRQTPFARDAVAALAAACRKHDLLFGIEYALLSDWQDPDGLGNHRDFPGPKRLDAYLERKALPQIRELVTRYDPDLFFAYEMSSSLISDQRARDISAAIRTGRPDRLTNRGLTPEQTRAVEEGRLTIPSGSFASSQMGLPPAGRLPCPFEITASFQNGWGFDPLNERWFDTGKILHGLVDVVAKGGHYRMNIALDPAGRMPGPIRDRLSAVGRWLAVNGEAIHGCGPSPFGEEFRPDGPTWRCTRRGRTLYFILSTWPGTSFTTPRLDATPARAYLLADPARAALPLHSTDGRVTVELPASEALLPVLAVECGEGL